MFKRYSILLLVGLGMAACRGDVVARVDGEAITTSELETAAMMMQHRADPIRLKGKDYHKTFTSTVLQELIDRRLIAQAARAAGITLASDEIDAFVTQSLAQYNARTLTEVLRSHAIDETQWRREQQYHLLTERYIAQVIAPTIIITPKDVRAYYEAHRDEFQHPDAVAVRHIVVDEEKTAKALYQRLLAGENFAKLAMEFSMSPESQHGGDLGWIERGTYPAVFEETCFRLPVGAMSTVVTSPYGYHLFKVKARRRRGPIAFAEVRETIRERLHHEALLSAYHTTLETLRHRAAIDIVDDLFTQTVVHTSGPPQQSPPAP
ncbi:MAG: peptidyl-prolyl cis-trans isomerase [Deltaproteobacteria bacterium]|nr:peptidyl-prolyl cis-trans isomerase [Deltaproteobacteria bacterium]